MHSASRRTKKDNAFILGHGELREIMYSQRRVINNEFNSSIKVGVNMYGMISIKHQKCTVRYMYLFFD